MSTQTPVQVLVVDDSVRDAELVLRQLRKAGYELDAERVDTSEGLRTALETRAWDVALLDFCLPGFDALQALAIVRALSPDLPCIVVSGAVGEAVAVETMRAGARDYLLKDSLTRLPAAVRREMEEAAVRRTRRQQDRAVETLHQIAFAAGHALDPTRLAAFAADAARDLLARHGAALFWWEEERRELRLLAESVEGTGPSCGPCDGHGAAPLVFESGGALRVDDYGAWPAARPKCVPGAGSLLAVPLVVGERTFGSLVVWRTEARPFNDGDERVLALLGAQVAPAIRASGLIAALRRQTHLYESVLQAQGELQDVILVVEGGRIVYANAALAAVTGHDATALRETSDLYELVAPEQRAALEERVKARGRTADYFETTIQQKGGARRHVEVALVPVGDGSAGERRTVLVARDITARKTAEAELERRALYDDLTGLPNRVLLHDRLSHALVAGRRQHALPGVLFIDLDRFQEVNDAFGHQRADELLAQVGRRLRRPLREGDTVARFGGDEFAVLLPTSSEADLRAVAEKLLDSFQEPFAVGTQPVLVDASIGIAVPPDDGSDAETLLRRAGAAARIVKRRGGSGYARCELERVQEREQALLLSRELARSIEREELVLHYQPIADLRSGAFPRVEALARWQHADRGLIPPGVFIPLAEETGFIKPLALWVLNEALRQWRAWDRAGLHVGVAVNVSMRNLRTPDLTRRIAGMLEVWQAPADALQLEITETAMMSDPESVLGTLEQLRDLGVSIAVDDFGTGYSSLAYLRQLPAQEIKIDRSFISEMTEKPAAAAIVRAMSELAHQLGMRVVAEGVETHEAWDLTRELGCDYAQGNCIAAPMTRDDAGSWFHEPGRLVAS